MSETMTMAITAKIITGDIMNLSEIFGDLLDDKFRFRRDRRPESSHPAVQTRQFQKG